MALRDWFIILFMGAVWGSSFVFNEVLIRELGPLWVAAGRISVGALGCWVFLILTHKKLPRRKSIYAHMLVLGVLSYTIPFTLFPLSQQYVASGVAAIVNAMTPIMTVIISHFWLGGEKATFNKSAGVVAGFIGVTILAWPALSSGGNSQIWAIGGCLGAAICYAIALNYLRSFRDMDPTVIATMALTGGALAAIPLAFLAHGVPKLVTVEGWGALLGIGLLATSATFLLMYRILPRVGATNFSVVTFIAPLSTIILGFIFLGETIHLEHVLGMLGIFVGLLLIDGRIVKRWQKVTS